MNGCGNRLMEIGAPMQVSLGVAGAICHNDRTTSAIARSILHFVIGQVRFARRELI